MKVEVATAGEDVGGGGGEQKSEVVTRWKW